MTTKEILEIIAEYLKIVFSWPTVSFVISVIFIFIFKGSIKLFLENIASIKVGPIEASQKQPKEFEAKIAKQIKEKKEKVQDKDKIIKDLEKKSELYEFAYLSLFLVPNSKYALLWFNNQDSKSSTKDNFVSQFLPPSPIINPLAEKAAIFNALLVNELLEQKGDLFQISKKGVEFLRYIKLVN